MSTGIIDSRYSSDNVYKYFQLQNIGLRYARACDGLEVAEELYDEKIADPFVDIKELAQAVDLMEELRSLKIGVEIELFEFVKSNKF